MSSSMTGKSVLVTGGGSGIGRCTAHELAHLGANVAIVGRTQERLDRVTAEIREDGGTVEPFTCDIRDEERVQQVVTVLQALNLRGITSVQIAGLIARRIVCFVREGEEIGAGKTIDEVLAGMNQVAEGVKAASVIMEFADKYGISMPIAREVDGVVNHGSSVEQAYRGLMVEKPGHEVHGSGF